jgi:hypothetical protein
MRRRAVLVRVLAARSRPVTQPSGGSGRQNADTDIQPRSRRGGVRSSLSTEKWRRAIMRSEPTVLNSSARSWPPTERGGSTDGYIPYTRQSDRGSPKADLALRVRRLSQDELPALLRRLGRRRQLPGLRRQQYCKAHGAAIRALDEAGGFDDLDDEDDDDFDV